MQWVIPLSAEAGPLFQQVYAGLRKAILSGGGGRRSETRQAQLRRVFCWHCVTWAHVGRYIGPGAGPPYRKALGQQLVPAFTAAKWPCDRHTASLEQKTLAEFISSGMYERYLRRVRGK